MTSDRNPRRRRKLPASRKAVAVVRVSSGEQVLGQSLEQQEEAIRQYAERRGLEVVQVFRQDGESAGKKKFGRRSGGAEILAMIQRGEVTHVISTKLDRLFRNVVDCGHHVEDWEKVGVTLHLVDEEHLVDRKSPSRAVSKMILHNRVTYAQFERDLGSERTKAALDYRRRRGEIYSRIPPFGFENCNDGKLRPVDAEQRTLARMKRMRAQKLSYREIADRLNSDGVPTKTGAAWSGMVVLKVLRRLEANAQESEE